MNTAQIYSIPIKSASGFGWKWRSAEGETVSRQWFIFYYDCLSDARRRGYHVELQRRHGPDSPGGELPPSARANIENHRLA
jgi:hypothetical protein